MIEVMQIAPNHADHISGYKLDYLTEMFDKETITAQRKYDGERMLIHFYRGQVWCTSRRFSKKTGRYMENQERLANMPKLDIGYTVIDCECYSSTWSDIAGILHSLPERALSLQKTIPVKFACFDCLFYDEKDLRSQPYYERLEYLFKILSSIEYDDRFHFVEQKLVNNLDEAYDYRDQLIDKGYEGCVIKSLMRGYYDKGASLKMKRFETVDCVVIDYQTGSGKYASTVGALILGYYEPTTESFVRISNVNCGTDAERDWWRDNWLTAKYKVIEVKCQEITDKSLRHPVYVRLREDKDYTMITKETIFK